jgi:hypothetical protein
MAVAEKMIEERYGKRFAEVETRSQDYVEQRVSGRHQDWDEYKEKVNELMIGQNRDEGTLEAAYYMARGLKDEERQMETRRKAASANDQGQPGQAGSKRVELTEIDKEFAAEMGLSHEEFAEWSGKNLMELSVPGEVPGR